MRILSIVVASLLLAGCGSETDKAAAPATGKAAAPATAKAAPAGVSLKAYGEAIKREQTRMGERIRSQVDGPPETPEEQVAATNVVRSEMLSYAEVIEGVEPPARLRETHRKHVDGMRAWADALGSAQLALVDGDEAKAERLLDEFKRSPRGRGLTEARKELAAAGLAPPVPRGKRGAEALFGPG